MRFVLMIVTLATGVAAAQPSPAELKIRAAERSIAAGPQNPRGYVDLAMALAYRARETADPEYYDRAEAAVRKSLQLAPGNFEARKARAWILVGKHQFAQALAEAEALNREAPDDVQVYGFLVDAYVELGKYAKAEEAAQWMLDLRPGNVAGLTRAAHLREIFGDVDGAVELMTSAFQRTPALEREHRAWILTQIGRLLLASGNATRAEQALKEALRLFPEYHYALGALAEVRTRQKRHVEAADIEQRRYRVAPHPENLFALAEALERAGKHSEAAEAFARFEREARREMESQDNANRELILYYAGRGKRPSEALRIARAEAARRADIHTLGALAWALHSAGRRAEAQTAMRKALAFGTRDPTLLAHARQIDPDLP